MQYIRTLSTLLGIVKNSINNQKKCLITAINVNVLYQIENSKLFKNQFRKFDYITFDGYYAILWAKMINKENRITQISADILMKSLFENSVKNDWTIGVIGGSEQASELFSNNVKDVFPNIKISFHNHGYFNESDSDKIIELINEYSPNILLVGLSVPKEHYWVVNNKDKLKCNVIITCGGYIEQTAEKGINYYPGEWVYKLHLNWIYRIIKEPRRLFGRYFIQGLWYIFWLPIQLIRYRVFKIDQSL